MDNKEYIDQIQKLGTRFMNEGARAWERYARSLTGMAPGVKSTETLQKDYLEFAQTKGVEYMRKIMQCNLDYYTSLMNAGLEFSSGIMDTVSKQGASQPEASPSSEAPAAGAKDSGDRTELHFSGKPGSRSTQAFLVANNQGSSVEVSFEISEFISEDGKTKTRVPVSFKPAHFVLAQGEEQVVECTVKMDKSLAAGQQNAALARVIGFPDMMISLLVSPKG